MTRNLREDGRRATGGVLGGLWDDIAMSAKMRNCPYCGFRIAKHVKKCGHCQEWLVHPDVTKKLRQSIERSSLPPTKPILLKSIIASIGILFLVIYFGASFLVKITDGPNHDSRVVDVEPQPLPPPPGTVEVTQPEENATALEIGLPKVGDTLSFKTEISRFTQKYKCPAGRASITWSRDGLGPLFGCISGIGETAKYWINGLRDGNSVENIKVMWNDWRKDGGSGIHADAIEADRMLEVLAQLYLPSSLGELQKMFKGTKNLSFSRAGYMVEYRYQKGPMIDERVIVLTPIRAEPLNSSSNVNSSEQSIVEPVAKFSGQDAVANAYAICAVFDSSGVTSGKCSVSGWHRSVDVSIDTSGPEAIGICNVAVGAIRQKGIEFDSGWKIRIFSPFSGDKTIAICDLS